VTTAERGGAVGDYVAWLTLGRQNFDVNDPVMANVERLNLATSAILTPVEDAGLKVTPLIFTGPRAMPVDVEKVRFMPDILGLLREYRPGGKPLMLAARISGDAALAFPEQPTGTDTGNNANKSGASGADSATGGQPGVGEGKSTPGGPAEAPAPLSPPVGERRPIEVMVVGDADMLYDRFWVQSSDFFGERVDVPTSNNADFVVNALENLADAEALIGLRGRGSSFRPFTLVEALRRDAEAQYRAKEQGLQERLKDLQQQLRGIERQGEAQPPAGQGGDVALSAEDKAAIERFRSEMLAVRKQLRDVQHALRSDIESLEEKVKFFNIAAVPLVLGGTGCGVALFGRLRRARGKRQVEHA
jgi:ABC-type uncharacterized transport system involved in gliding motility auxiliary subunit